MGRDMSDVLTEVRQERRNQDATWGEQNHEDGWWMAILAEEVGEAAQETLRMHFGGKAPHDLREELIQVAAVAVAWVEALDRRTDGR